MNREQIIQMALDVGFMYGPAPAREHLGTYIPDDVSFQMLERFAYAIIEATKEEDAKICESTDADGEGPDCSDWHSKDYAKAIRASKCS